MKIEKITPQIAALYLGAKCDLEWLYTDTVDNLFVSGDIWKDIDIRPASVQLLIDEQARITPHLRRLDSITEAEAREVFAIANGYEADKNSFTSCLSWLARENALDYSNKEIEIGNPSVWLYLLGKGFDLFGLIEQGLAKDVKTETVNS